MTEPENALTKQYQALVAAEGAELEFTAGRHRGDRARSPRWPTSGWRTSAPAGSTPSWRRCMDELLFELPDYPEKHIVFDRDAVRDRLEKIIDDDDLRRYIL